MSLFTSKAGPIPFHPLQKSRHLFINVGISRGPTTRLPKARLRSITTDQCRRSFTFSTFRAAQPSKPDETRFKSQGEESTTEQWISILENTTSAPWLFSTKPGAEEKLILAYTLLFQIVLYLSRPEGGEQFLTAFGTAPAPPESEIGRARVAVPIILRATVHHISTIPLNSSLRMEHPDIFNIFGALQAIHDMYLTDTIPDLETWTTFWTRVQPVVIELGLKLDEKGFGLPKDEVEEELKESK